MTLATRNGASPSRFTAHLWIISVVLHKALQARTDVEWVEPFLFSGPSSDEIDLGPMSECLLWRGGCLMPCARKQTLRCGERGESPGESPSLPCQKAAGREDPQRVIDDVRARRMIATTCRILPRTQSRVGACSSRRPKQPNPAMASRIPISRGMQPEQVSPAAHRLSLPQCFPFAAEPSFDRM